MYAVHMRTLCHLVYTHEKTFRQGLPFFDGFQYTWETLLTGNREGVLRADSHEEPSPSHPMKELFPYNRFSHWGMNECFNTYIYAYVRILCSTTRVHIHDNDHRPGCHYTFLMDAIRTWLSVLFNEKFVLYQLCFKEGIMRLN